MRPGRRGPADHTVVVATAAPASSYASRQCASAYAGPSAIASHRSLVNVDLSNAARCTATRSPTVSASTIAMLSPQSSTGAERSRSSGTHRSPSRHPRRANASRTDDPKGASTAVIPSSSSTTRSASAMSCASRGSSATLSVVGPSSNPTAAMSPSTDHTRTASTVARAPKRQNQPTSPGCSWNTPPTRCQPARARRTSASPSTDVLTTTSA